MTNVYFPKPRRFDVFKMMYVQEQQRRHHDVGRWNSFAKAYEYLGGVDCVYDVWCAFNQVSSEAQKRIIGFTDADITAFLEREDAGKAYAEAICN